MNKVLVICLAALTAGCVGLRPKIGLGWDYSYKRIAPDTYSIHISESRMASTAEAEDLFRVASRKVVELNHCRDYRITSYSRYLEYAFLGAAIPVIDGEIVCLH